MQALTVSWSYLYIVVIIEWYGIDSELKISL